MPIDDSINNRTFEELFSNPISFEIPFFQRAYSWQKRQWKQLIDDVWEQIIIDVIDQIGDKNDEHYVSASNLMVNHFFRC